MMKWDPSNLYLWIPPSINLHLVTPLKLTRNPKLVVPNRNLLFQGSIFRGYVSFREGTPLKLTRNPKNWCCSCVFPYPRSILRFQPVVFAVVFHVLVKSHGKYTTHSADRGLLGLVIQNEPWHKTLEKCEKILPKIWVKCQHITCRCDLFSEWFLWVVVYAWICFSGDVVSATSQNLTNLARKICETPIYLDF